MSVPHAYAINSHMRGQQSQPHPLHRWRMRCECVKRFLCQREKSQQTQNAIYMHSLHFTGRELLVATFRRGAHTASSPANRMCNSALARFFISIFTFGSHFFFFSLTVLPMNGKWNSNATTTSQKKCIDLLARLAHWAECMHSLFFAHCWDVIVRN